MNKFIEAFHKADYIVGHNLEFDYKIVGTELVRLNVKEYDRYQALNSKKKICTMTDKRVVNFCALLGRGDDYKWPKLTELYFKIFNKYFAESHNAEQDIWATAQCFWELVKIGVLSSNKYLKRYQDSDLTPYESEGKWSWTDSNGRIIIPCKYDKTWPFSEGLGKYVFEEVASNTYGSQDDYYEADDDNEEDSEDSSFELSYDIGEEEFNEREEKTKYRMKIHIGFVNPYGATVFEYTFEEWFCKTDYRSYKYKTGFQNGFTFIDYHGIINKKGDIILKCKLIKSFSDGIAAFYNEGKWGYVNENYQVILMPQFSYAGHFVNGKTFVKRDKKIEIINSYGTTLTMKDADTIYFESSGYACIGDYNISHWRKIIIDLNGKEISHFSLPSHAQSLKNYVLQEHHSLNDNDYD